MKNKHVIEYLDYYILLPTVPEFAVLLRGEWGTGKTWFIRSYLDSKPALQYLFVSLNGVSTFKEIEDAFFQQLHPVLASKGMKILGKLVKGVLKTSINFDLNNDGKSDGSISTTVPELSIPDYLTNLENKVLIFDDLERCSIPIQNVLGYINGFVEGNGLKVLIIGNESEIIKRDIKTEEDSFEYLRIKEKLVGKSFNIISNLELALDSFTGSLKSDSVKNFLNEKKSLIRDIYEISKYENLRHLRLTILDFERFFAFLPNEVISRNDVIEHILQLFFSISFELRHGTFSEDDIYMLFGIDHASRPNNENKTPTQIVRDKYSVFGLYYHPVNDSLLRDFFKFGTLDKEALVSSIKNSIYYEEERTANWIKLWRLYDLNDDDFDRISKSELSRFFASEIDNKYELFQISCLFITLSNDGLIDDDKQKILEQAKLNFDKLKLDGKLSKNKHEEFPTLVSFGLKVAGEELEEVNKLFEFVYALTSTAQTDDYPEKAGELLGIMKDSINEFTSYLTLGNSQKNIYYDIPILKYVAIDKFMEILVKLDNKDKRKLVGFFQSRYEHSQFNHTLLEEADWLTDLASEIKKVLPQYEGKVSGKVLEGLYNRINSEIAKLKSTGLS